MSDEKNERIRLVNNAMPIDWDRRPIALAHEIMGFLDSVKDTGTNIDSDTDGTSADLWVTVQGVEYFITIKKSKLQLSKELLLPPASPI